MRFRFWPFRSDKSPLVESDARALIERFGDDAYFEARLRQHEGVTVDADHPPDHWECVKEEIRRRQHGNAVR